MSKFLYYVLPNSPNTIEMGDVELSNDNPYFNEFKTAIKIKLKAKPVDNSANNELINYLSNKFNKPKSSIVIKKGDKSRYKLVQIDD